MPNSVLLKDGPDSNVNCLPVQVEEKRLNHEHKHKHKRKTKDGIKKKQNVNPCEERKTRACNEIEKVNGEIKKKTTAGIEILFPLLLCPETRPCQM